MNSFRLGNPHLPAFSENWGWFFVWGVALLVLGIFAIMFTSLATVLSVIVLGFVIFTSGIVILIDSFTFWWKKWRGFSLHFLMGLLYVLVGLSLIGLPILASLSLTLMLGMFYTFIGLSRLYYAFTMKSPRWGWTFFNGLIALLLGVLILMQWPASGLFIIGLFIGIDLIFTGWAYIMAALGARAGKAGV
jgi:uncharacterized membrane protein HdeD (DUF308 family)